MVATQQGQYLTFVAGGEEFALGILDVRDIVDLSSVTKVPSAPRSVVGVVTVQGRDVPVVDLGVPLGFAPSPATNRSCVVVVESGAEVVGVLADTLKEVIEVPRAALRPPGPDARPPQRRFARAFVTSGDRRVSMLDLGEVLRELRAGLARAPWRRPAKPALAQ
jgi:purine-binding chemotaxis protein CheW